MFKVDLWPFSQGRAYGTIFNIHVFKHIYLSNHKENWTLIHIERPLDKAMQNDYVVKVSWQKWLSCPYKVKLENFRLFLTSNNENKHSLHVGAL